MKFKFKLLVVVMISIWVLSCKKATNKAISYSEYHQNINQVKALIDDGKLDLAKKQFDVFSQRVDHVPSSDLLLMANACAATKDCQQSQLYLKLAVQSGLELEKVKERNDVIQFCPDVVELLKSKTPGLSFNQLYKSKIDSMFQVDQQIRMQSDYEQMGIVDSLNMQIMLDLIDQYGFPSEKIVGKNTAARAFIIILHMDQDIDNQVFGPIIQQAFEQGFLAPRQLAWVIDRRRNWGPQELEPYYYQVPSKSYDSLSEEQKREIDLRRDSIGLEPVNGY